MTAEFVADLSVDRHDRSLELPVAWPSLLATDHLGASPAGRRMLFRIRCVVFRLPNVIL